MRARLLLPPAMLFLLSAVTMAAELVAPRRMAPLLGTGSLLWAGIIGAFLLGLAVGYAWGGRLADRPRRGQLPLLLLLAAGATWLACGPADWLPGFQLGLADGGTLPAMLAILLSYAPLAIVMGLPLPALTRAALALDAPAGRTLGVMAAAGSFGSVVGTFAAGFWLVPSYGLSTIGIALALVVVVLAVLALCLPRTLRHRPVEPERAPRSESATALPAPLALAALAAGALLGMEMLAGRMASVTLGNSLYTWTAVIGVTLSGLALGNFIGGRLADRHPPRLVLGRAFLLSSVAVASGLWAPATMTWLAGMEGPWLLRVLISVAGGFLLPSIALGVLTPTITRALLADPADDGRTVGRVAAYGTFGALAATLLVLQVIVPVIGVPAALLLIALTLSIAAERVRRKREIPLLLTLVLLLVLATAPFEFARNLGTRVLLRMDGDALYSDDSAYYHVAVRVEPARSIHLLAPLDIRGIDPEDELGSNIRWSPARQQLTWLGRRPMTQHDLSMLQDRLQSESDLQRLQMLKRRTERKVVSLNLDRLVHGFIDMEDPSWLGYDYELLYGAAVDALWPRTGDVRCFFIGGGSYTFQRRQLAIAPERTRIVSAEIDPAVTKAARAAMGLTDHPHHRIVHADARRVLEAESEPFHFVFGDAFHDVGIPWHLTTREWAQTIRDRMHPDGVYLLNVVDVFELGHSLAAQIRTLREVFPFVTMRSVGPRQDGRRDTFLIVAAGRPVDVGQPVLDNGIALPVVRYTQQELDALIERTGAPILTDEYAPIEALIAPVVARRASEDES